MDIRKFDKKMNNFSQSYDLNNGKLTFPLHIHTFHDAIKSGDLNGIKQAVSYIVNDLQVKIELAPNQIANILEDCINYKQNDIAKELVDTLEFDRNQIQTLLSDYAISASEEFCNSLKIENPSLFKGIGIKLTMAEIFDVNSRIEKLLDEDILANYFKIAQDINLYLRDDNSNNDINVNKICILDDLSLSDKIKNKLNNFLIHEADLDLEHEKVNALIKHKMNLSFESLKQDETALIINFDYIASDDYVMKSIERDDYGDNELTSVKVKAHEIENIISDKFKLSSVSSAILNKELKKEVFRFDDKNKKMYMDIN